LQSPQSINHKFKKTSLKNEYSSNNVKLLDKEEIKNVLLKDLAGIFKNKL